MVETVEAKKEQEKVDDTLFDSFFSAFKGIRGWFEAWSMERWGDVGLCVALV